MAFMSWRALMTVQHIWEIESIIPIATKKMGMHTLESQSGIPYVLHASVQAEMLSMCPNQQWIHEWKLSICVAMPATARRGPNRANARQC